VQPTFPSPDVSVVCFRQQKRAPSDGKIHRQGLVTAPGVSDMRALHRRLAALLTTLGGLATLALAGGANFKGW
jgi:hypothetical protein